MDITGTLAACMNLSNRDSSGTEILKEIEDPAQKLETV